MITIKLGQIAFDEKGIPLQTMADSEEQHQLAVEFAEIYKMKLVEISKSKVFWSQFGLRLYQFVAMNEEENIFLERNWEIVSLPFDLLEVNFGTPKTKIVLHRQSNIRIAVIEQNYDDGRGYYISLRRGDHWLYIEDKHNISNLHKAFDYAIEIFHKIHALGA